MLPLIPGSLVSDVVIESQMVAKSLPSDQKMSFDSKNTERIAHETKVKDFSPLDQHSRIVPLQLAKHTCNKESYLGSSKPKAERS